MKKIQTNSFVIARHILLFLVLIIFILFVLWLLAYNGETVDTRPASPITIATHINN
ncbi:MAG: hypothetical protein MJ187_04395 [Alphaproteobacteria bacterium]|nr:hypothetical protein [Alphaproteobacteria bacterium]